MDPRLTRPLAVLAAVAVIALAAPPLMAQQHPNHLQGFQAEHLYQLTGLDNIALFNGNLNIRVPLGGSYPVGGDFAYSIGIVYTGNVWEYEEKSNGQGFDFIEAVPRRSSNAGLGWKLTFGENDEFPGFGYRTPDGSVHAFNDRLHATAPTQAGKSFTTDGSYLRGGGGAIEFPDGTRHWLGGPDQKLSRIDDRFNNALDIQYLAAGYSGSPDVVNWKLTDSLGRVHWVYFKPAPAYAGVYRQGVVDRVVVSTFNGGTATYTFNYSATSVTRGRTDVSLGCLFTTTTVVVPLLTSITQPDGSQYNFTYDPGPYHQACSSGGTNLNNTDSRSAHLTKMTLPTRGAIEWSWNYYQFPQQSAGFPPYHSYPKSQAFMLGFSTSVGVVERRMRNADGTLHGTWTYQQGLNTSQLPIREGTTTVTDPLGNRSIHYFSVYSCRPEIQPDCPTQDPEPSGWSYEDYGLPFTRNLPDAAGTRFLSTEVRQGASTVKRRTYLRYENSGYGYGWPGNINQRVASSRTVFVDDGNRVADVTYSSFDGHGNYRTATTGGTFDAGNARTTHTEFNPGSSMSSILPAGTPWILGTFTFQTATEAGVTARSDACFEAATGFLQRTRTLRTGTTQGANDLVTRYSRNAAGQLTAEEHFGGDTQALGTGGLCGLALPAPKYRIDHTYQSGTLRTSQYAGQSFKVVDREIDYWSGRVKTSRDVSGLATNFEYDAMGRLTWVKPAQEGWTQYTYGNASGTTPAKAFIHRRANGGGTELAYEEVHFDPYGRLAVERKRMANGSLSDRRTFYNALGWVTAKTEWGTTASTSYELFDPFGRPGRIRPPDGSAHDVTLTYQGVRALTRTVRIGTAWNGSSVTESPATTTEVYDRQGRLYQVFEPANADGTNSTTTYSYDVGNRLRQVNQWAKNAGGANVSQNRFFNYDNRGFLTSETHPEKGFSGGGTVSYFNYDARGHAGRMIDGPNDLTFTYDGAERVTQIRETGSGFLGCVATWTSGPRCLKTFSYATGNGTGDWRLGKLQSAKRYNYPVIGSTLYTAPATETYTYGGKQGRVSQRDTSVSVNGGSPESFTQSWTWNDLGDPASTTYPKCTHAGCTAATNRTVSPAYTHGFLTAVPGYASSITYHPNGQVNAVTRLNNVIDTYEKDPNNMARPNKISAMLGTTIVWNGGVHAYDGAGNMTKAGNAYFVYDAVSRIKNGLLYLGPGAGGATRSFDHAYDGFGNLQSLTANGVLRNTPTAATTNRLTGSVTYDAAGNLTYWNGANYSYDRFGSMGRMANGSEDWLYLYTADDERIWSFKVAGNTSRWTLRDLDGKVLREYQNAGGTWSVQRDYVYRGSQLLAAHTPDLAPKNLVQFHLDHLGTPRAVTNTNGARIAYHVYYPFGEEATSFSQDTERMKFTGHERDLGNLSSAADDLDYMHARFYNPQTGRFLSTDPKKLRSPTATPARWNRYSYAINNPLAFTDPDGRDIFVQVHRVAGTRFSHSSIRIEPNDQGSYRGDRRFVNGNQDTRRFYATLGAGPEKGKLVSDVNRSTDVDLSNKTEEVKLDLGGRDENEVITALFQADTTYKDDVSYQLFPSGDNDKHNSNSYVSGVLRAAGITPPELRSNVPGYDKPVPAEEFEPAKE